MKKCALFFLFMLVSLSLHAAAGVRSNVCLNMIVKNEAHVIERCLESVLPLIDSWVILDTGSTDGTQDVIRNFFAQRGIPGELFESPWVNFAHNRNQGLSKSSPEIG